MSDVDMSDINISDIEAFLSYLSDLDVKLWVQDDREASQSQSRLRCNAPKGVLTPDLSKTIAQRKGEILAFLRQPDLTSQSAVESIPIASRDHHLPLSFAQQRLWFLAQLDPNSYVYNIPAAYRLRGILNVNALKQSLCEMVRRHESLRTTFPAIDGRPSQVIIPDIDLALPLLDLHHLSPEKQEVMVQRQASEAAQQPFDLAQGPLLRTKLLRLREENHVLLLTMHHIVSDGWSMGIFFRELTVLYTAFTNGQASPLSKLPIQYADFAVWQRQWLQGDVLASQLDYWKQQLGGLLPVLELPTDHPRPPIQTYRGARQTRQLSQDLTVALNALSQQQGVTLYMTLLAAFQTLLHRYCGQTDIIVGSPIAGRNRLETEGLIGFFINTLALRIQLGGNPSFQELLVHVRKVVLAAYSYQDLPFEQLIEALQLERDPSRSPLFQVLFVLQNFSSPNLELPDLSINPINVQSNIAKFDVSLYMAESDDGLQAWLEYNTDLFEAATITRMLRHFQTLLEGIVANPDQHLSDLPLLTAAERHQLLVDWNNTQTEYPQDLCIHQLVEAQVEQTPDAIALVFGNQQLTYQELNHQANQLAHHLQTLGVKSETLVGVCLERSPLMIIALLAILKAGGAYAPLDPTYPPERLAFMLDDTQVSVLLSQQTLLEKLPGHQAHIVCLDQDWSVISRECQENPNPDITAETLAYVMYTSGSTGKPKGVSVRHQGVVRLVKETNYANLRAEDVFLQLAPISFDASTFEIWGCLLNGAQLILFPAHTPSLEELGQIIQQHQVTILWLTAGLFHLMVDQRLEDLRSVRQLLAGGDVLSVPHVQRLRQTLTNCQLINGYGPTENTTFTCCHPITDPPSPGHSVPIGRPIANTQVYILDRHQQPVPVGVYGELYVGGDGLARGHLNCPDLTAEKFIPNPFWAGGRRQVEGGGERRDVETTPPRLYKTGDLGRYLPDGNIEFLGRIDHQVKIRGFRIELGEIETVLAQHSAVKDVIVTVREDAPDDKRLIAYVVPRQNQAPICDQLRRFLKQQLPGYMTPGAFVLLEALPLTPNGKIDRRALLPPAEWRQGAGGTFTPPRDDMERQLTKIWENIFGIEPIGLRDDFFELGGHSLLAVRLFAAIEKTFDQRLPLAKLFEGPTIEHLASVLRQDKSQPSSSSLVAIQPLGRKPPLFCVHSGFGEVLFYQNLAFRLDLERPVYGLQALGADGQTAPLTQIEEMAAYYIKEIQTLQPKGPYFLGGLCVGGIIALEMACQLQAQGYDVPLVAVFGAIPLHVQKTLSIHSQPSNALRLTEKLHRYRDFILQLSPQERVVYILDTAYLKVQSWLDQYKPIFHKFYQRKEQHLPQDLQRLQILQTHYIAQRDFEHRVFDGQLIAFWASGDKRFSAAQQLRWADIATGGVEIYDAPDAHITHGLKGPSAQSIAEILRRHLNTAEADTSRIHSNKSTEIETEAKNQENISRQNQPSKSCSSLIAIKPDGSNPPLFCIHGSDGSSPGEPLYGYDLARHIESTQPIYGLRAVGLDGQQSPLDQIEEMAAHYLDEIRALFPSGPYLFLGLDMGGLVAFEMAQQLSVQGQSVPLLGLVNTLAPKFNSKLAHPVDKSGEILTTLNSANGKNLLKVKPQRERLKKKFDVFKSAFEKNRKGMKCKFIQTVKQEPLPDDLRYFQIQQSLIQAQNNYKAKVYDHTLTLFRLSETTTASHHALGWRHFIRGSLEVYDISGNRTNIFKAPNIQCFSKQLENCIDKALAKNGAYLF
ncbi:MAG: amino acid adenylation domain-containing protein [Pseudanabaenales cyanobacterium]|nr:amino acid adenylation domain-containing protein [Pseudanabaenales cyanobacterium]